MRHPIVLVVDDERDIRDSLTDYLRRALEGVGVVSAEGPHEAAQLLRLSHVDLILADHFMPDGSGTDLLHDVAADHPKVVRMLMTAFPESEVLLEACNAAHVHQIFTKPLDPSAVAADIAKALEDAGVYPERPRRDPLLHPSP